jgi:Acyl-CoA dehydrogenase, C-terminal domain
LTTPEGGGTASTMAAVMEELGRAFVGGPLVATFAANQLLPDDERTAVGAGDAVVTLGSPPLIPWAPIADLIIELEAGNAWLSVADGPIRPVDTLAGEPWGRCALRRGLDLGPAAGSTAFANCALAAYVTGAGQALLDAAVAYARDRSQFGRSIGEFQAVAHPLGECAIRLHAASVLTKLAAEALARGDADRHQAAATARVSASNASLAAAYQAHQTFGAMGFAEEGPVGTRSALIRQLTLLPPAPSEVRDAVLAGLVG